MALIWPAEDGTFVATDTSAVINLNATGYAAAIIRALPARIVVVDAVCGELEDGRGRGRQDADRMHALIAEGLVEIVQLGAAGQAYFEELVIGPAYTTLDDGEAATIAYALEHGLLVLLDESKATRICAEQYPQLSVGCTVDLLAHPALRTALGMEALARAVFNALYLGRMRVFPHHIDWIIQLIGPEQAARCHSLPRSMRIGVKA